MNPFEEQAVTCRAWPEQELGPHHVDIDGFRGDVVEDRAGVPLHLGIKLVGPDGIGPVTDAVVEIWHCDALRPVLRVSAGGRRHGTRPTRRNVPPGTPADQRGRRLQFRTLSSSLTTAKGGGCEREVPPRPCAAGRLELIP